MTVTLRVWHPASTAHVPRTAQHAEGSTFANVREHKPRVEIGATEWLSPAASLLAFDRRVHAAEDQARTSFELVVHGEEPALRTAQRQIGLRYQRLFPTRNAASSQARFDATLARHAALHDRAKPLVRADHDHALDVWQWLLRLAPEAGEALQLAALFHDIERLTSEPERRVEQHAPDYLAFKQRHAAQGAAMMCAALRGLELPAELLARAAELIAQHEQPGMDAELALLNDADALSFFALNSPGFLAYFGPEHTAKKVRYTLDRMRSSAALSALAQVRLEPPIARMIAADQPT